MDISKLTALISDFRKISEKDSINPDNLGALLQNIANYLSRAAEKPGGDSVIDGSDSVISDVLFIDEVDTTSLLNTDGAQVLPDGCEYSTESAPDGCQIVMLWRDSRLYGRVGSTYYRLFPEYTVYGRVSGKGVAPKSGVLYVSRVSSSQGRLFLHSSDGGWDHFECLDGNKVNKVTGKGLSSNDFTDEYQQKILKLEQLTEKIHPYISNFDRVFDLADYGRMPLPEEVGLSGNDYALALVVDSSDPNDMPHIEVYIGHDIDQWRSIADIDADERLEELENDYRISSSMGAYVLNPALIFKAESNSNAAGYYVANRDFAENNRVDKIITSEELETWYSKQNDSLAELIARWEAAREEMYARFNRNESQFARSEMGYDAASGRFFLNGLTDITPEQARVILDNPLRYPNSHTLERSSLRTNLLLAGEASWHSAKPDVSFVFNRMAQMEVLRLGNDGAIDKAWGLYPSRAAEFLCDNPKLRKVLGKIEMNQLTNDTCPAFLRNNPELTDIRVLYLNGLSFDLSRTPKLSLESLRTMIAMVKLSYGTFPASSIKLHPDVWAKIYSDEEIPVPGTDDTDWSGYTPNILRNSGTQATLNNSSTTYNIWAAGMAPYTTYSVWWFGLVDPIVGDESEQFLSMTAAHNGSALTSIPIYNQRTKSFITGQSPMEKGIVIAAPQVVGRLDIAQIALTMGTNPPTRWSACSDDIEDAELREKTQWRELHYMAAARNITFTV